MLKPAVSYPGDYIQNETRDQIHSKRTEKLKKGSWTQNHREKIKEGENVTFEINPGMLILKDREKKNPETHELMFLTSLRNHRFHKYLSRSIRFCFILFF